jgi:2-succinyl-5-enolpyruvyl-6-hydroxy-3-cyclohexene-1-carboxylate synthase
MQTEIRGKNHLIAKAAILELVANGVTDFCICPGSQSFPLALAVSEDKRCNTYSHFDERGMGFFALGLAKAKNSAVAIITTSGTAVGNLMPAVMEAFHAEVPLMLITADREDLWQDCGMDQTCNQVGIFGNFVKYEFSFPATIADSSIKSLQEIVAYSIAQLRIHSKPVHLNFRFSRPLFSLAKEQIIDIKQIERPQFLPVKILPEVFSLNRVRTLINEAKSGVIVVGELQREEEVGAITKLASILNWPIIPEITSQMRFNVEEEATPLLAHGHWYLGLENTPKPDLILQFGKRTVQLMNKVTDYLKLSGAMRIVIADRLERVNPGDEDTLYLSCEILGFCNSINAEKTDSRLLELEWIEKETRKILSQIENAEECSELSIIRSIFKEFVDGEVVYLGNSLPIRAASWGISPSKKQISVIANRGLSGIDGNIATCAGYASFSEKVTAILGDLSLLYDLNSLAFLSPHSETGKNSRIVIVVINNSGGGIFSFLPQIEFSNRAKEVTLTSHSFDFSAIAEQFGLSYFSPKTIMQLTQDYLEASNQSRSSLIEINVDINKTKQVIKEIEAEVETLWSKSK